MQRIIFALLQLIRYKPKLQKYLFEKKLSYPCIEEINPDILKNQGCDALILDFDGVLAPHGNISPLPSALTWLQRCCDTFGANNIFILSNKPLAARQKFIKKSLPNIKFVVSSKKKPYPDGIESIIYSSKNTKSQFLLIDDRLATGILAAEIANIPAILITNPYVDLKTSPITETFFVGLRKLERILIKL